MLVYISYKSLDRTDAANAARIADDVNAVRLKGQLIDNANRIWESFAIKSGGNVIEQAGSTGSIQVEAEYLTDLDQVVQQYSLAIDNDLQVGIGMKLSESNQALKVLEQRGKSGTLLWEPDLGDQLAKAAVLKQNKGEDAGFEGHHTGQPHKSADKPHSEVDSISKEIKDAKSIAPKEKSNKPEASFHAAAKEQSKKDQAEKVKSDSNTDKLKGQLVQVLNQIKTQTDSLAQLKEAMPDVYQTLTSLVQNVILLGKEVFGNSPEGIQKTEETVDSLNKAISNIQPGPKVNLAAPDMGENNKANPYANSLGWDKVHSSYDYSHLLPDKAKAEGLKMTVHHHYYENIDGSQKGREKLDAVLKNKNGVDVGKVSSYIRGPERSVNGKVPVIEPHSDLHPDYKGRGLGTSMYEAAYSHAKNVLGINKVEGGAHSEDADKLHKRLSKKHGFRYVSKKFKDTNEEDDLPFQPYSYTLKNEFADINEDLIIGKGHGVHFIRDELDKSEDDLFKGLGEIAPGKGTPISIDNNQWGNADAKNSKSFDYSHVIPEKTRAEGYKLHVNHGKHGNLQYFTARVMSPKGENVGYVQAYNKGPNAIEPHSFIEKSHRGKGLGIAMYESLYSRAKESGITHIKGGEHSADAARVHQALSRKHGMNYNAKPNPEYGETTLNEKGPYSYALKAELDPHSVEEDALDKASASGNSGQNHIGLNPVRVKHMPAGTIDGQKMKIKTQNGVGWISARKGLVQSAQPGDPLLGSNTGPVSPQSKDAKIADPSAGAKPKQ